MSKDPDIRKLTAAIHHRERQNPSMARKAREQAAQENRPKSGEGEKVDETRRGLIFGGAAAGVGLAVGAGTLLSARKDSEHFPEEAELVFESQEEAPKEGFERHVESYRVLYGTLTRNEVVFLKEDGSPYEATTIERVDSDEVVDGIVIRDIDPIGRDGTLNQIWLDYHRQKLVAEHGGTYVSGDSPRQMNILGVVNNFANHHLDNAFPNLSAEGRQEYIDSLTFMKIVTYFAHNSHQELGIGSVSPLEYLRAHVLDRERELQTTHMQERRRKSPNQRDLVINAETQRLWRHFPRIIPALAAQESQFNNGAASDADANGMLQFIKSTWHELGYPSGSRPLPLQLEGLDRHMRIAYSYIEGPARRHFRSYFSSDSDFIDNFLLPVLINTYNSGHDRLIDVMNWFAENHLAEGKPFYGQTFKGRELYHHMAHTAAEAAPHLDEETKKKYDKLSGYRKDSNEYVERIFALVPLIEALT